MTAFVETDFLVALAKDDDWLQGRAKEVLDEREVVTSSLSYLELLLVLERHTFDFVRLFSNLLDLVPVRYEHEQQIVLKGVTYFEEGLTPFDAFHASTAETEGLPVLSSDNAYEDVDSERVPLEADPDGE
jgi:predicted nucleic acid-binding protein